MSVFVLQYTNMALPPIRNVRSHTFATVGRLTTHLALLTEAKLALDGVDLKAGTLDRHVCRSLQRALAYSADRIPAIRRRKKER
jgi:hypothetical protein